eukprot:1889187-Rhodomonas_salina.1
MIRLASPATGIRAVYHTMMIQPTRWGTALAVFDSPDAQASTSDPTCGCSLQACVDQYAHHRGLPQDPFSCTAASCSGSVTSPDPYQNPAPRSKFWTPTRVRYLLSDRVG